jgi:hypothetical protein
MSFAIRFTTLTHERDFDWLMKTRPDHHQLPTNNIQQQETKLQGKEDFNL